MAQFKCNSVNDLYQSQAFDFRVLMAVMLQMIMGDQDHYRLTPPISRSDSLNQMTFKVQIVSKFCSEII